MVIPAASLAALFLLCAPDVSPVTLNAIVKTESEGNPFQVANISDGISRSFNSADAAENYLDELTKGGKRFSAGLMQIYSGNFKRLGLTNKSVFEFCKNIKAGAQILEENYSKQNGNDKQMNLLKSLSIFYSGNDESGFKKEKQFRNTSYVERVKKNVYAVPELKTDSEANIQSLSEQSNNIVTSTDKETPQQWDVFGDFK